MGKNEDNPARTHFRIEYPKEVRPKIEIDGKVFDVINLSEGGVKFSQIKDAPKMVEDSPIEGKIVFFDSEEKKVIGTIIRSDKSSVVLQLSQGVPYQKIMNEQRFVLKKFGGLKRPDQ